MNDNNQTYLINDDTEIYISDIIFYLLRKWRSLIVLALIGALIGAGVCVLKSGGADGAGDDSEIAALEDAIDLDDDLIADMELAYQYRIKYRNLLEYISNSLYMQINPDEFYRGILRYYISDTDEAYMAACIYRDIINEEGIYEELAKASGLDCDPRYLYEMISVSIENDGAEYSAEEGSYRTPSYAVVTFTVNSVDEESCTAMTDLLREKVDEVTEAISEEYGYSLTKLADSVSAVSDDAYQANQNTYITNLNTYHTNYGNLEDEFSDEELEYYTAVYLDGADYEESVSGEGTADSQESASGSGIRLGSLIKWAIVGVLLGIVIWGVWYVCIYLMKGWLGGSAEITENYGIPILGRVKDDSKQRKGIDAVINRFCAGFRERPDEMEYVIDTVKSFGCGKTVVTGDTESPAVQTLTGSLSESIEHLSVTFWSNRSISAKKAAKEAGAEIIVVVENRTKRGDLRRELECCNINGIKVLGIICVVE